MGTLYSQCLPRDHLIIHSKVLQLSLLYSGSFVYAVNIPARIMIRGDLRLAVEKGDVEEVKQCLRDGVDANSNWVSKMKALQLYI